MVIAMNCKLTSDDRTELHLLCLLTLLLTMILPSCGKEANPLAADSTKISVDNPLLETWIIVKYAEHGIEDPEPIGQVWKFEEKTVKMIGGSGGRSFAGRKFEYSFDKTKKHQDWKIPDEDENSIDVKAIFEIEDNGNLLTICRQHYHLPRPNDMVLRPNDHKGLIVFKKVNASPRLPELSDTELAE
jgi:hypothetical protein